MSWSVLRRRLLLCLRLSVWMWLRRRRRRRLRLGVGLSMGVCRRRIVRRVVVQVLLPPGAALPVPVLVLLSVLVLLLQSEKLLHGVCRSVVGAASGARAALCWCRCRSRVQRTVGCCVLWHTLDSTCCVSRCSAAHEKNKEPASDVWRLRVRGFCFPAAAASTGKRPHPTAGGPRKQPSAQPLPFFHLRSFWLLNKLWVCKSRQRGVARGRDRRAVASAT